MIKRIKKVLLIGSVVLGATMCMGNTNNTGDSKKIKLDYFTNIESMNAEFIKMWLKQAERLETLNKVAITQMKSLLSLDIPKKLPNNLKQS